MGGDESSSMFARSQSACFSMNLQDLNLVSVCVSTPNGITTNLKNKIHLIIVWIMILPWSARRIDASSFLTNSAGYALLNSAMHAMNAPQHRCRPSLAKRQGQSVTRSNYQSTSTVISKSQNWSHKVQKNKSSWIHESNSFVPQHLRILAFRAA